MLIVSRNPATVKEWEVCGLSAPVAGVLKPGIGPLHIAVEPLAAAKEEEPVAFGAALRPDPV
jgi:hypothetical protein